MARRIRTSMKVDGLWDLEAALAELPKATGKNVMRRGMQDALEPMADIAKAHAPEKEGRLKAGIRVGTKLSKAQASEARDDKSYTEAYMGPRGGVVGVAQEFGTYRHGPQPYMRPAWDQDQRPLLERMKTFMWARIKESADRQARKVARAAKKGGR